MKMTNYNLRKISIETFCYFYYLTNPRFNYTVSLYEIKLSELIKSYKHYVMWHKNKYPDEKYTSINNKLKSLVLFTEEKLYEVNFKIEIKFQERENYLFGNNLKRIL